MWPYLGSNICAFHLHLAEAVCCYKIDQWSFTLLSELKDVRMEAPGPGKLLLFHRGQEASEIKGSCTGWMREHVTDEPRNQRAIWGYITEPCRPPSDAPSCRSSVVHLWRPQVRQRSWTMSTSGWVWWFADTEQCISESSHTASVGYECDFNIITSLNLFISSRRAWGPSVRQLLHQTERSAHTSCYIHVNPSFVPQRTDPGDLGDPLTSSAGPPWLSFVCFSSRL